MTLTHLHYSITGGKKDKSKAPIANMKKEEKENVVVFIASPVGMNGQQNVNHVQTFLNMRIKNLDGLVSQRTKLGLNIVIS